MLDAWIYDGLRTPFGRHAGALAPVRPDDLVAGVLRAVLDRGPWKADDLEDVILGCTNQAGEDSRNVARHAALLAGFPPSIPAMTVNRLCASGLAAVVDAARAVTAGEGELFLAGGVESMSRAPFAMAKADAPWSREARVFDTTLGARFPNPRLVKRYGADTMPETGDNVAREQGITREEADAFALRSQERAERARATGFLAGEIVAVEVPGGRGATTVVREDEHPRPGTTREALARLKPLFEGGVVTAGNASGVNDGAAALLVGSRAAGERAGVRPIARILASAAVGVEPRVMGVGPAFAIPKALDRAGLSLPGMDVIEVNEAFASQVLACLRLLGLPFDDPRVNPNGGAIALGHPLGASGARLALTAARELRRRGGGRAVVSLCIGVGQGLAVVMEATE
ncbi:MAG TPA: 3-oxoadipyl-CoA thiolase [Anaeromyxobacteraceae bacterium]|nr:3-oxoadipyl-CoA thiolase [Anaeromyxobacteraceae bacterium]